MHGLTFVRAVAMALMGLTVTAAHADTITLDEALRRATARPTVAMAAAEEDAMRADASGARRPIYNPELGITVGPSRGGGVFLFGGDLSLFQTIERGGKRAARVDAAEARVRVAGAQRQLEAAVARLDARRAFELAQVQGDRVEAARDAEQVATEVAEATEQTLTFGKGTQLEVNLVRAELGRAKHDRLDADSAYETALAELATAIGAAADERLEPAGRLASPATLPWTEDDFVAVAQRNRPELAGARAEIELARAETKAADAEAVADVTLGISYGFSQDPDIETHAVLFSASFPLLVRNRNQGARAASRIRARRAEIDGTRVQTEIEREARLAYQGYQRAREAVLGFDQDVIGKLHDNLELARASFTSGKLDYFTFSQARRDLIASQRDYLDAISEVVEARYAVLRAAGEDLP